MKEKVEAQGEHEGHLSDVRHLVTQPEEHLSVDLHEVDHFPTRKFFARGV
jgi:hypothetical protein